MAEGHLFISFGSYREATKREGKEEIERAEKNTAKRQRSCRSRDTEAAEWGESSCREVLNSNCLTTPHGCKDKAVHTRRGSKPPFRQAWSHPLSPSESDMASK